MKDNKTRFNIYRKRITKDKEINSNKEESNTLNDLFFIEKESKKNLRNNETDEKDVSK